MMLAGFLAVLLIPLAHAIRPEQLDIRINEGLAKRSRKVVFGSVVEIANLKSWSNEELVDLAFVAHGAAATAHQAWRGVPKGGNNPYPGGLAKEKPAVTAVLQVDNTAYIATSGRGGPYLYDPPEVEDGHRKHKNLRPDKWPNREDEDHPCNAVHRALRNCQLQSLSNVGHRTGGSCAEQFAALSFCSTSSPQSLVGGRIIAIHTRGTETYIIPPCYNPDKEQLPYLGAWGCHAFVSETGLKLNVIPENTVRGRAPDVADLDKTVSWATFPS